MAHTASAELEASCVKESPERRGELGCSLVEEKSLPGEPLLWHIDRFHSGERARMAVSPTSVALEVHGMW